MSKALKTNNASLFATSCLKLKGVQMASSNGRVTKTQDLLRDLASPTECTPGINLSDAKREQGAIFMGLMEYLYFYLYGTDFNEKTPGRVDPRCRVWAEQGHGGRACFWPEWPQPENANICKLSRTNCPVVTIPLQGPNLIPLKCWSILRKYRIIASCS
ncbi:hypothetical protein M011DRAFT_467941 [Sporormia fimetaria CBS 119925]|uniref:Uncharacterized protein n=1 Tax=Sporormia fimetaria CBS 119925 TaxID=1340428 RepID=A0A6A6V8T5_9PLEO|nr:hypothetical protein M011DRAFT_467941 [Sporormia fimetaria CBS 119925]